jgi:predicted anti-sigma-YlaC factor YlaD
MITCDEFLAEFGDYLENQVSEEVRKELELHLSQCRTCRVLYDSSRKTVKVVTDSSSFELPQSASDAIVDRIMAKLRTSPDSKD